MRFKFAFCSKGVKTIQAIKIRSYLEVIPLINADSFSLLQDSAIVVFQT